MVGEAQSGKLQSSKLVAWLIIAAQLETNWEVKLRLYFVLIRFFA